jgi:hypothetical protein
MKTNLPEKITTVEEAKRFLYDLFINNETFHPEDDPLKIIWQTSDPTIQEKKHLKVLMNDIYDLPGNKRRPQNMVFDPCEYLLELLESKNVK